MNEPQQPVLQILDAYKAAVNAKDVDVFVSLYAPDLIAFDLWGEWSYRGIEAWRKMVTAWFGSLGDESVVVEMDKAQVIAEPQLAVVSAFVTFKGISAEGQELRAMQNRFTWVLKNRAGEWRIVHEHSSAPIDPETSKGILKRP